MERRSTPRFQNAIPRQAGPWSASCWRTCGCHPSAPTSAHCLKPLKTLRSLSGLGGSSTGGGPSP
eukprot:6994522-Pyramimonas_sp.AAC.2